MMLGLFQLFAWISCCLASVHVQNLGGKRWTASGSHPPSSTIIQIPQTEVPGCVHTDWMIGKLQNQDLYYRFNDDSHKWIAETNWKYTLTFQANEEILNTYEQWLIFEGMDTIADIYLNGKRIGQTSNMFVTYRFNVSSLLQQSFNMLEVSFQSAVTYANATASKLSYSIPPDCPPEVQHGFCHVNMIRKEQCSFSWDWGPATATQGIWKPVYLMSLNYAVISEATATFDWDKMNFDVDVQFLLVMFANDLPLYGNVTVRIDELKVNQIFENVTLPRLKTELTNKHFSLDFSKIPFKKWWPNGYGSQHLYNVSVQFSSSVGYDNTVKTFLFGFRKVELIQEPLLGTQGLSFYFRINDMPIFAKGANWIPADAFKNRIKFETYENLLNSAVDAHMNMLRVWGGGIYEDNRFYELADKLGIMLWQDFMFACALYPSSDEFLNNVTEEISNVIWKLKHHPSIVIWAGNNENEAALSTNWYNTSSKFDLYKQDYLKLYASTIEPKVESMDLSRPFVISSPSNGKESITEGGVAKNPYDPKYGDVHYYNYNDDCLDSSKYSPTRSSHNLEASVALLVQHHSGTGEMFFNAALTLLAFGNCDKIPCEARCPSHSYSILNTVFSKHSGDETISSRFSSEYGFQSWPSLETLLPVTAEEDRSINSKWADHRQHHATGNTEMLNQISMHFKPFSSKNSTKQFMDTIYMTQVMQGLCYKSQTEFYRRSRNETVREAGHTMGALYWQLNDIWQAPTWSSIEYGGKWKALHYFAAKFFAPVALVVYEEDASLYVYSASDVSSSINGTLVISVRSWDGFGSTGTFNTSVVIPPHKSVRLVENSTGYLLHYGGCEYKEVCYISVHIAENSSIPENYFFPVPFKDIEHLHETAFTIEKVTAASDKEFVITISATMPALFVWLEASGVKGRFSDNAFVMTEKTKTIKFYSWESQMSSTVLHQKLTVRSINELYNTSSDVEATIASTEPSVATTWLDDVTIKLTFAVIGLLLIAMASAQVICLVLRLNKPTHRPKSNIYCKVHNREICKRLHSTSSTKHSWASGLSDKHPCEEDDAEGMAFLIKTKNAEDLTSKVTEFRFYII